MNAHTQNTHTAYSHTPYPYQPYSTPNWTERANKLKPNKIKEITCWYYEMSFRCMTSFQNAIKNSFRFVRCCCSCCCCFSEPCYAIVTAHNLFRMNITSIAILISRDVFGNWFSYTILYGNIDPKIKRKWNNSGDSWWFSFHIGSPMLLFALRALINKNTSHIDKCYLFGVFLSSVFVFFFYSFQFYYTLTENKSVSRKSACIHFYWIYVLISIGILRDLYSLCNCNGCPYWIYTKFYLY